jgi:preprotein translocase subunit SecA
MNALNLDENMPIENRMLSNVIESAQRKIEGRNFSIRKNVLNFDDVMSRQREIIYDQRSKVLEGEDIHDNIVGMIKGSIQGNVDVFLADNAIHDNWNLDGLRDHYRGFLTTDDDLRFNAQELGDISKDEIFDMLYERAMKIYEEREALIGSELMRELERVVLLRTVDSKWMNHIDDMDELKRGISLRSLAQHDPVVEYRKEGFDMFDEMIASIREDTSRLVLTVQIKQNENIEREQVAKPTTAIHGESDGTVKKRPVRNVQKIGRNDPCPCGSGKKYKNCCLGKENQN